MAKEKVIRGAGRSSVQWNGPVIQPLPIDSTVRYLSGQPKSIPDIQLMKFEINAGSRNKGGNPIGGRLFLTVFGLGFAGLALAFITMGVRDALQELEVRGWPETPARVISSSVIPGIGRESKHGFAIAYEYQWNAELHTGSQLRRKPVQEDQVRDVERLVIEYPAGREITCHVNPADPTQSVVEAGIGDWRLPLFGFPFLVVGIGVMVLAWWRRKPKVEQAASLSQSARKTGIGCGLMFFGFFVLMGGGVLVFAFIIPAFKVLAARDWPEVPCVIESSEVRSHSSDDGTTYSVDILYRYEVDGRELRSNRYQFMGGSSSGREGKSAIVRQYRVGREAVCYVNPDDPTDAVLERGFTAGMWFGLLPLVFVAVGVGGMFVVLRKGRTLSSRLAAAVERGRDGGTTRVHLSPTNAPVPVAERILKPRHGPWVRLLGGIAIAVFWNGITSVFVWQAVASHLRGRPEWFLTLFIIPFVLIGLGMIGYVGYAFVALFNPRPTLRLRPGSPRLGESLECDWEFTGATSRIRRLTIEIEGVEESQYRRGTQTYTDKSVFARLPVLEADHPGQIASGGLAAMIPGELAPGFKAENNRIYWVLRLTGDIHRWPDVCEEYEVEMLPSLVPLAPERAVAPAGRPVETEATPAGRGHLELSLENGEQAFAPGSMLRGTARWRLSQPPRALAVRLFWFTRGKGGTDVVIVGERTLSIGATGDEPFQFELRADQPPSIDGRLISVTWAVELVTGNGEEAARVEFVVSQGAGPIKLSALPKSAREANFKWKNR